MKSTIILSTDSSNNFILFFLVANQDWDVGFENIRQGNANNFILAMPKIFNGLGNWIKLWG